MRLMEARLQAVLSRNMYSLQGLDALIRPPLGQVCQALIVESNCTPGSALRQAAKPIWSHRSFASYTRATSPVVRHVVSHLPPSSSAWKKESGMRTELFEFCPLTVWYASPLKS